MQERIEQLEATLQKVLDSEEGHTSDSCWPYDVACTCRVAAWRAVLGGTTVCSLCGSPRHKSSECKDGYR